MSLGHRLRKGAAVKEKKPRRILNYLFCEVWKLKDIVRDHSHANMAYWEHESPQDGKIKIVCRKCRCFIGFRPSSTPNVAGDLAGKSDGSATATNPTSNP
ncbi:MAG: hypothetical protein U0939_22155 [Pirellulales bacterium]